MPACDSPPLNAQHHELDRSSAGSSAVLDRNESKRKDEHACANCAHASAQLTEISKFSVQSIMGAIQNRCAPVLLNFLASTKRRVPEVHASQKPARSSPRSGLDQGHDGTFSGYGVSFASPFCDQPQDHFVAGINDGQ